MAILTSDERAKAITQLSQASMIALMGIVDIKNMLLRSEGDTVPIGLMLRRLDELHLEIVKTREGSTNL